MALYPAMEGIILSEAASDEADRLRHFSTVLNTRSLVLKAHLIFLRCSKHHLHLGRAVSRQGVHSHRGGSSISAQGGDLFTTTRKRQGQEN